MALGSDAFFPFGDNVERAHRSGEFDCVYFSVIMAIARSIFACSGISLFSVTTFAKRASSITSSFLPCSKIGRADRDNTIDVYMSDDHMDVLADGTWENFFTEKPEVYPNIRLFIVYHKILLRFNVPSVYKSGQPKMYVSCPDL